MSSVPTALPKAHLATLNISQGVSQGLLIKTVQPAIHKNVAMPLQAPVELQAPSTKMANIPPQGR